MKDEANPLLNRELYARAERAALEAFAAPLNGSPGRRLKLMDRAATAVFKRAGTPPDAADLYATAITAEILERVEEPYQLV